MVDKPGLTEALQQLSALLPVALECCTATDTESQNSAVVEKLRGVLLDVIGTITSSKGALKRVTKDYNPPQRYSRAGHLHLSCGPCRQQQAAVCCPEDTTDCHGQAASSFCHDSATIHADYQRRAATRAHQHQQ